jgi:fluoroacetyl-CoA thioesterase
VTEHGSPNLVGLEARQDFVVDASMSAESFGNPGFPVLGTPALVGLVETVAIAAVAPFLAEGTRTVGGRIELTHKAPTPVGMPIVVHARVTSVEGRSINFEVSASDSIEPIAEGTHLRFQVHRDRFLARVAAKSTRADDTDRPMRS